MTYDQRKERILYSLVVILSAYSILVTVKYVRTYTRLTNEVASYESVIGFTRHSVCENECPCHEKI